MTIAFGVIGLALLAGAVLLTYFAGQTTDPLRAAGIRVQGLVVHNKPYQGRVIGFRPVVRFTTQDGQLIEAVYQKGFASVIPQFPLGRTVWLAYNPSNYVDFLILSS